MENNNEIHSCCFFGHRKIDETPELINNLTKAVENLIMENAITDFYFGSKSDFNSLCLEVVTSLREKYPHIKRIYVRSAFPDISDSYENYLLESFDETYFPEKIRGAGRASYTERNQEMINKSDYCVVYYDENYLPQRRTYSRRSLADFQPKSGTHIAYDYAMKKKRKIINLFTRSENNV